MKKKIEPTAYSFRTNDELKLQSTEQSDKPYRVISFPIFNVFQYEINLYPGLIRIIFDYWLSDPEDQNFQVIPILPFEAINHIPTVLLREDKSPLFPVEAENTPKRSLAKLIVKMNFNKKQVETIYKETDKELASEEKHSWKQLYLATLYENKSADLYFPYEPSRQYDHLTRQLIAEGRSQSSKSSRRKVLQELVNFLKSLIKKQILASDGLQNFHYEQLLVDKIIPGLYQNPTADLPQEVIEYIRSYRNSEDPLWHAKTYLDVMAVFFTTKCMYDQKHKKIPIFTLFEYLFIYSYLLESNVAEKLPHIFYIAKSLIESLVIIAGKAPDISLWPTLYLTSTMEKVLAIEAKIPLPTPLNNEDKYEQLCRMFHALGETALDIEVTNSGNVYVTPKDIQTGIRLFKRVNPKLALFDLYNEFIKLSTAITTQVIDKSKPDPIQIILNNLGLIQTCTTIKRYRECQTSLFSTLDSLPDLKEAALLKKPTTKALLKYEKYILNSLYPKTESIEKNHDTALYLFHRVSRTKDNKKLAQLYQGLISKDEYKDFRTPSSTSRQTILDNDGKKILRTTGSHKKVHDAIIKQMELNHIDKFPGQNETEVMTSLHNQYPWVPQPSSNGSSIFFSNSKIELTAANLKEEIHKLEKEISAKANKIIQRPFRK